MATPKDDNRMVFARVHPPRPLQPEALESVLVRLASDATSAPLVFEARSRAGAGGASQTSYWLGTTPKHLRWVRRTLRDLLVGLIIDSSQEQQREPVKAAARLKIRPSGLALTIDRPEAISTAILSALNQQLFSGEELVLQLVFGARRSPRHPRPKLADPSQPWWTLPTAGVREAPTALVKQHHQRALQAGMVTTIRLGVCADSSERRHRLLVGLFGGISTAKAPNTHLTLVREPAYRLDQAVPPQQRDFAPAAAELVGLLAWPLGSGELPSVPPLHPKPLPIRFSVGESERAIGVSNVAGDTRAVPLSAKDGTYHLVVTGPTGSGKSLGVFLPLIRADIYAGRAVAVIDPKLQLIRDVTDRAVPKERIGDVVIIDPSDPLVAGFNPLDIGDRDPDVVVDGLLAVFAAVFAEGWGPRTQDITHAGLLSLARAGVQQVRRGGDPYTLLDLPRLFTDAPFRRSVVGHVAGDPALGPFWASWEALSPQAQTAVLAPPSNKWRQYLMRPAVRRILGQPHPAFRLRDIFRQKKVVLVALNEGLIGPITAQLLGGLIVSELWAATLERAAEPAPETHPASVWIDEVQNYLHLPTSLDDALNASRSMGVSWNLAHQFRSQMPPAMLSATDSNARTKIVYRPSDPKDAAAYARMTPELEAEDFMALGKFEAYATVVHRGEQQPWCSIRTLSPPEPTGLGDQIRKASQNQYGSRYVEPAIGDEDNASVTGQAQSDASPIGRKRRRRS